MAERLDKYLANAGIGTRSEVKKLLKQERVQVNDLFPKGGELKVNPQTDRILVDGKLVRSEKNEYLSGKRDLFAVMIALKLTISNREFRRLVKEVDIALKNLYSYTTVLTQETILSSMGFPQNWKDLLLKS